MLTIKQISENFENVIKSLEKKHFKDAEATLKRVLTFNDTRRNVQNQLDKNLSVINSTSKSINQLMIEGKIEEAEAAKIYVTEIKDENKSLQLMLEEARKSMLNLLYTIPNIPYDDVPEGCSAKDNIVVKMGGVITELPQYAMPLSLIHI